MNYLIKKLSFFIFILCLTNECLSQNSFVNAPSASSGVATNGEDATLNYNNGTANVTLPLMTLSDVGNSLPISLSYQTGGIKVSQPATEVGLGWSLNVGGSISREVKGFPDDIIAKKINVLTAEEENYSLGFLVNYAGCIEDNSDFAYIDTEPDVFTFNILGFTGRFFFNKKMEIIQVNESDIKIDAIFDPCENEKIQDWKISLPDGTVIYFGGEYSFLYDYFDSYSYKDIHDIQSEQIYPNTISNWHIRKIEFSNGRDIKFNYAVNNHKDFVQGSNESIIKSGSQVLKDPNYAYENIARIAYTNILISSIESDNYIVEFNHQERMDLSSNGSNSPNMISGLSLSTKNGECLSSVLFDQSYFQSNEAGFYYPDSYSTNGIDYDDDFNDLIRLKLNKIKLKSCNDNTEYTYDLDYYDDASLPRRLSCAQDLWGFNNGVLDNKSLVPKLSFKSECFDPIDLTDFNLEMFADRSVNETFAIAGSLKKITYPNGYFNEFNYESNSIHEVVNDFSLMQVNATDETTMNYTELTDLGLDGFNSKFQIDFANYKNEIVTINIYSKSSASSSDNYILQQSFEVNAFNTLNLAYLSSDIESKFNVSSDVDFDLKVEMVSNSQEVQLMIIKYFEAGLIPQNSKVGGLRISSIETPYTTKNYNYTKPTEKQEYSEIPDDEIFQFKICKNCDLNLKPDKEEAVSRDDTNDKPYCTGGQQDYKSNVYIPCNVEKVTLRINVNSGQCGGNTGARFAWTGLQGGDKELVNTTGNPISENFTLYSSSDPFNLIQPGGVYNLLLEAYPSINPSSATASFKFTFADEEPLIIDALNEPQSNGHLIDVPSYLALYKSPNSDFGAYIDDECYFGNVFRIYSNPSTSINSLNGGHIIYSKITETIGDGQFGYTEYEFFEDKNFLNGVTIPNNFSQFFPLFAQAPTVESIYLDPIAGLPKSVKIFNANNELVSETISKYESDKTSYNFFRSEELSLCSENNDDQQIIFPATTNYNLASYWVRLVESKTSQDGMSITTNYSYRNDKKHHMPIEVISTNDNAPGSIVQNTYYAADVDEDFPFREALIDLHAINLPLISLTDNGGKGGSKTEYSLVTKYGQQERTIIRPKSKSTAYLAGEGSNAILTWKEVQRIESYQNQIFPQEVWSKFKPLNTYHVWEDDQLQSSSYSVRTTSFDYDDHRRMFKSTDPLGLVMEIEEYDGFNRVLKSKNEVNGGKFISEETTYTVSKIAPERVKTTTTFPQSDYDIPARTVTTSYDERGLVISSFDKDYMQNGATLSTSNKYNELGSLITKFENDGFSKTIYSNDIRQRVEEFRPKGSYYTIKYDYSSSSEGEIEGYNAGAFSKNSVTDENGITSYSLTDFKGNKVLSVDGMGFKTRYYYDYPSEQLVEVVPPGSSVGNIDLNYTYKYTDDFKLEEKTIPGRNKETYKYDPILELETETTLHNGKKIVYHYNDSYPDFLESVTLDGAEIKSYIPYHTDFLTSWVKEEKSRVLGTSQFLTNTYDYDDIGRTSIATVEYLEGGKDVITNIYDDLDNLRESTTTHTGNDSYTTTHYYDYDKGLRVDKSRASLPINGENKEIVIHENIYDSRDWLTEVKVNDGLHTNSYKYHLRGYLTKINSVEATQDPSDESCEDEDPPVVIPGCEGPFQVDDVSLFYDCYQLATGTPTTVSVTINSSIENADGTSQELDSNTYAFGFNGGGQNESLDNPTTDQNSFNNSNFGSTAEWIYSIVQDCIHQANNPQTSTENSLTLENMLMLLGDELPNDPTDDDDPDVPNDDYDDEYSNQSLFGLEIHYEDGNSELGSTGYKNGNISWIEWKAKGEMYQAYGYQYDNNYRLTAANYKVTDPGSCFDVPEGAYNTSYSYDDRGNFLSINRNGVTGVDAEGELEYGEIDALTFGTYSGNQISSVTEAADPKKGYLSTGGSYGFSNGNLVNNPNISNVTYNYLDRPTMIISPEGSISITYDADGNKLKQIETSTADGTSTKTVYMGQMEYVDNERSSLYHEGGRIMYNVDLPDEANDGPKDYEEWSISDHLGNTRIRYIDKNNDTGISINRFDESENEVSGTYHYYPYGMLMEGNFHGQQGVIEKYQYNGIENSTVLGSTVGLTMYRMHDAAIGGWYQVDPAAESLYSMSPYQAMGNNPILYSDPDGDFIPQLVGGLVGGFVNLADQALKGNVTSWGEGLAYFGNGAVAGVLVSVGQVGAARAVTAVGNKGIQVVTGKFNPSEINSWQDVAGLAIDVGTDLMGPGLTKAISKPLTRKVTAKVLAHALDDAVVSGGGEVIKRKLGEKAAEELAKNQIEFALTFSDEFVVSASRIANGGGNVVYHSVKNGVTQYVGITNNLARRSAEHLAKKGISITPLMKSLSRADARSVEQALIEIHKLGKNGGTLLNKINSISLKNPIYGESIQRGYDLLKTIGY